MITFPKVKTAAFATYKRLNGYHLRTNPEGAPETDVYMVKTLYDGINNAGLRETITHEIIRTTDHFGNTNLEKRTQQTCRIYDFEKKEFGEPVHEILFTEKNNNRPTIIMRNKYSRVELNKLREHPKEEITKIRGQMQEANKEIQNNRPNFFKVLCYNLTNKKKEGT